MISQSVSYDRATLVGVVACIGLSVTSGRSPTLDVVNSWGPAWLLWSLSFERWAAEALVTLFTARVDHAMDARIDESVSASGYTRGRLVVDCVAILAIGVAWRLIACCMNARRARAVGKR
mgnify:CR=1 FL=1